MIDPNEILELAKEGTIKPDEIEDLNEDLQEAVADGEINIPDL